MKRCAVITHLAFEDLGALAPLLRERGYQIHPVQAGGDPWPVAEPAATDLLVVLGGPIAVYDRAAYPWLEAEIALVRARLEARRPTLGLCLGAQIMAAALGADVHPAPAKELGFAPVQLTHDGAASPLGQLGGVPVLHWHGDTFAMPEGAAWLAYTDLVQHQAFAVGTHALGLQFHVEVEPAGFERWLIGHAAELTAAGIDIPGLRAEMAVKGPDAVAAGRRLFAAWLDSLRP